MAVRGGIKLVIFHVTLGSLATFDPANSGSPLWRMIKVQQCKRTSNNGSLVTPVSQHISVDDNGDTPLHISAHYRQYTGSVNWFG